MSSKSVAEHNRLELAANMARFVLSGIQGLEHGGDIQIKRSMGVARTVSRIVRTKLGVWDLTINLEPGQDKNLLVAFFKDDTYTHGKDEQPTVFWEDLPEDGIKVYWLYSLLEDPDNLDQSARYSGEEG